MISAFQISLYFLRKNNIERIILSIIEFLIVGQRCERSYFDDTQFLFFIEKLGFCFDQRMWNIVKLENCLMDDEKCMKRDRNCWTKSLYDPVESVLG